MGPLPDAQWPLPAGSAIVLPQGNDGRDDMLPQSVVVTEVGTRDGFQMEAAVIPTATKVEVLHALIAAGLKRIEATSFVSPRAVPQLADAAEVLAALNHPPGVTLAALVPNAKGAERAAAAGADEMVCFVSASETHNQINMNKSIGEIMEGYKPVAEIAKAAGVPIHGAFATAFGCPFEGDVPADQVARIAERFVALGVHAISLGDTTGMATPPIVARLCETLMQRFPGVEFALHFHNTRGVGLANVMEGLRHGIRHYESSIGGLGGCPFAAGATGNICTEDLVYLLQEMGIETGIDLEALIAVARKVQGVIGRELPGQVMKAGPRLALHDCSTVRRAVG